MAMTDSVRAQREAHKQQRLEGEVSALLKSMLAIAIFFVILPLIFAWFYVPRQMPTFQGFLDGVMAWSAWASIVTIVAMPFFRNKTRKEK